MKTKYKTSAIQALIVLVPTYLVAFATEKMVYTIPMLAAASFVAAAFSKDDIPNRLDDISKDSREDGGS
jgi:hypothetical protein|tara:strand:- start:98 stop:304 length:207 start_codon:yes stop_codon:yes gene_type:complete